MEQHAVPQDITGFKFKLVGDMTLVQFGELAGGALIAWAFLASPLHPVLRYPIAIFFGLFGAGLAFVPIEERPMHVWIFNFFRAIYRPTYFIWKRNNNVLQTAPKVTAAPSVGPDYNPVVPNPEPISPTTPSAPKNDASQIVAHEQTLPNNIASTAPQPTPTTQTPNTATEQTAPQDSGPAPLSIAELMRVREQRDQRQTPQQVTAASVSPKTEQPMTIEELVKRREELGSIKEQRAATDLNMVEKRVNDLTEQNKQLLMQIDEIKNKLYQTSGQDVTALNKNLDQLLEQKNKLASEIATTRDELNGARVAPLTNSFYQEPVNVKRVEKAAPSAPVKQAAISLTTVPNVMNGLVLDEGGKPLDGAILIMKDQNNNSIRALRTNRVGQFIASTPLSNGTYFIEVEKANYTFDTWQIILSGQVLEPLEIRAKGHQETQVN